MKVLVTGATGYIGGRLVSRLIEQGHAVRCLARDPARLEGRAWLGVDVVQGDALDPASLARALDGIEAAYYLIHSLASGESGFAERDRTAARNFGEAAVRAGTRQTIYLGGLGEDRKELSAHLRSRQETGEALRATGAPVTEFRAAVIVGSGSLSFEMIRHLVERLPVMIWPRWLDTRCQPIAIEDVLRYLVAALGRPEAIGRVFEIGGPDVLSYGEMIRAYARIRGLKRFFMRVPVLTPRLSSYWVDLVTPIPRAYARTLVEGLRSEVIVRDPASRALFGVEPTPYETAVAQALEGEIETDWAGSFPASARDGQVSLESREGLVFERRARTVRASLEKVFASFSGIGGRRGWYFGNALWQFRGLLDRAVGGVGMRRGRRHPDELRAGDALDFWRVESVVLGRSLRLRASEPAATARHARMARPAAGACRVPGCGAGVDGRCLEGYAGLADCPHAGVEPGPWLDLPEGADLDSVGADRVARAATTRVILLAGAADTGKTTLLASLYECFQRGPVAGYAFAGCETVFGFERRAYLGRIECGRPGPDTARTSLTTVPRWLHLRVRDRQAEEPLRSLLFSEIGGDFVRLARNSTDECRRLTLARRADHFAILVDGAGLIQRQQRLAVTNDAGLLLRSCLDAEVLGRFSFVDVLFTKWDLVLRSGERTEIEQFLEAFASRTRQLCQPRLGRLRFVQIAARPAPGSPLGFGHGLSELLASWTAESPAVAQRGTVAAWAPEGTSEFDRFLWRQLPALRQVG
jgi:uncharacterized protein YbjT (DUF2867 family)